MTTTAESQTLSGALAAYWSEVRFEDLPADVVEAAKRLLLDTIAAAVAGFATQESKIAFEGMSAISGTPDRGQPGATVWGRGSRLAPAQAALVNATTAHARELDDFGGCGHSGVVVNPAALATAEWLGADGKTVLAAIAAGYDVASRVMVGSGGYKGHKARGWHSTGTCGSFGAAAAAARVAGLSPERFRDALGIAGTFTGGTWAFLVDGAMTKRLHPGKAAENGVAAASLARSGMTGPREILEAEWGGFLTTYGGDQANPAAVVAGLGSSFHILRSGIKPYACCRGAHGVVDEYFALQRDAGFTLGEVRRLQVRADAPIARQLGSKSVETSIDAQFSIPYALAMAALVGSLTLAEFAEPIRTPQVRDFMEKVDVVAGPLLADGESPRLDIDLADGRTVSCQVPVAKGDPANPLTAEEFGHKVTSLMEPVLGQLKCRQVIAAVDGLDESRDVTGLLSLLA